MEATREHRSEVLVTHGEAAINTERPDTHAAKNQQHGVSFSDKAAVCKMQLHVRIHLSTGTAKLHTFVSDGAGVHYDRNHQTSTIQKHFRGDVQNRDKKKKRQNPRFSGIFFYKLLCNNNNNNKKALLGDFGFTSPL